QKYDHIVGYQTLWVVKNQSDYFRAGLTWPLRAHRFAPQALPAGCIFSVRGYSAFTPAPDLLATLALFNSGTFDFLFKTTLGRFDYPEFIVGVLQRLPWVVPTGAARDRLGKLARTAWAEKRSLESDHEASHAFVLPPRLNERVTGLDRAR